jgi:hypothetical protein
MLDRNGCTPPVLDAPFGSRSLLLTTPVISVTAVLVSIVFLPARLRWAAVFAAAAVLGRLLLGRTAR